MPTIYTSSNANLAKGWTLLTVFIFLEVCVTARSFTNFSILYWSKILVNCYLLLLWLIFPNQKLPCSKIGKKCSYPILVIIVVLNFFSVTIMILYWKNTSTNNNSLYVFFLYFSYKFTHLCVLKRNWLFLRNFILISVGWSVYGIFPRTFTEETGIKELHMKEWRQVIKISQNRALIRFNLTKKL